MKQFVTMGEIIEEYEKKNQKMENWCLIVRPPSIQDVLKAGVHAGTLKRPREEVLKFAFRADEDGLAPEPGVVVMPREVNFHSTLSLSLSSFRNNTA